MYKNANKNKHSHHSEFDLSNDLENIKSALANASWDVRGKAGEVFSQSIGNIKEKSTDIKDEVETYVTKKPFRAIGFALATGLVLGYFLRK